MHPSTDPEVGLGGRPRPDHDAPCDPATTEPAEPLTPRSRYAVIGGTLLWLAMTLGFLINTPTLIGPDEPYQFDRVVAAAHGDLIQDAGTLTRANGVRFASAAYVHGLMRRGGPSWAEFEPLPRDARPSLDDLGGNTRPPDGVLNNLTQHPPLYYTVMGTIMWLLPHGDGMPVDQLVLVLRAFNVLMVLPLPLIFFAAARTIFGQGPISLAAAFLPALVPGMARIAATINNDNLCVLLGALILWQCIRVLKGATGHRTALLLAGLAVAAALTKGTLLVLLLCIPVAYLVRVVVDRRLPSVRTVGILLAGAAFASIWWVRNLVVFGAIVPASQAWGPERYIKQLGGLRDPSEPASVSHFIDYAFVRVPLRFWGSLGLHEPPRLPAWTIWTLTVLLAGSFVCAVVTQRGNRSAIVVPWLFGMALVAAMVYKSWSVYSTYHALAALQGRYMYPGTLGLLLPVAVTVAFVLRNGARWAPVVTAGLATVVTGYSLWISVEYTWLPRGQSLTPADLPTALRYLAGHFPYHWTVLAVLVLLFGAALVGAWVFAVRAATARSTLVGADSGPGSLSP